MAEKDSSVEGKLAVDAATGRIEVSGKVTGVRALFKSLFPERFAKGEALHALTDNIRQQLASGKVLGELTPLEQALLLSAAGDGLRRSANRHAILSEALEFSPAVKGLLEAPAGTEEETAPRDGAPNEPEIVSEEEEVLFWERFWADAEVVSVPYMQQIYARILAGKAKSRSAFSLRTLDVIRCLDEEAATTFRAVAPYTYGAYLFNVFGVKDEFHAGHSHALVDAGLLHPNPLVARHAPEFYEVGSWLIRVASKGQPPTALGAAVYGLTRAGAELLTMIEVQPTRKHAIEVCKALQTFAPVTCEVATNESGPWVDWATALEVPSEEVERFRKRGRG